MNETFSFHARSPKFRPPPGACDCHLHIFGPASRYPYAENRPYTPQDALPDDAIRMLASLGLERAVLVQASPYGTDNRRLLDALERFDGRARAVAAVADGVSPAELKQLDDAGVRGVRLNIGTSEKDRIEEIFLCMQRQAERIKGLKWHLELFINVHRFDPILGQIEHLPVELVFDHMGFISVSGENKFSGLKTLLHLLQTKRCWVKLSAPYRLDEEPTRLASVKTLARALINANPNRVVWGSDWPHTAPHGHQPVGSEEPLPFRRIDTGRMLDHLFDWVPEKSLRDKILVDNPSQLYGFN
jgi:2-pyrone-4,6-dicarboxylate lactonase